MDSTHLHLVLNHLPLFGLVFGFLLVVWGVVRGYSHVENAGLTTFVLAGLIAIPVYLTGEPAEEVVEHLPGVSEQFIELHEEGAIISLILAIATGAIALVTLCAKRFGSLRVGIVGSYVCLLLSLVAGASMAYTANLGGEIRHTEIRTSQTGRANAPDKPKRSEVDHDE